MSSRASTATRQSSRRLWAGVTRGRGEVKTGTFRSATLFLGGGRAVVRNLTVQNNAGDGAKAGQALAVYADASRVLMENVNLYGNQDTLFTAPLPLQEREKNGFRGPRENTPPAGHRAVLQKLHDPRQHRLYLWRCKRCVRHLPP